MFRCSAEDRSVAPVIAVTLLVALVVVLATTVSGFVLTNETDVPPPAPQISVSHTTVPDGDERTVAVTLDAGDAVATDQLYVAGSKPLDIGGPPGSAMAADDGDASARENFAETAAGDPQVSIGAQWEASETVYLDPKGSADGVTIEIYWNTEPVQGDDPGTVTGDDAYLIAEFRV
ncbi:type IV pilin [Haloplanus rubicundus]|uniref:type IV pilin n=1 Tax=Haloplanus rubicundus TaxID=1547898 RepID=UPI001650DA6A|nr:type IV pilin [Haloplanus rubicundus]